MSKQYNSPIKTESPKKSQPAKELNQSITQKSVIQNSKPQPLSVVKGGKGAATP